MANPNWTRGRFLGCGSTATVSLASKHPSGDLFAVKSTLLSNSQLLRREKDIHSFVSSSPHIISYLGYDVTDDRSSRLFNLFLEYAPNGSLSDEIKRSRLEEIDIRSYTKDILMGLSHLHSMRIAHCDVKPQNVLIGFDNRAKISDLGCARFVDCCDDDTWRFMGTPMYMAPEVARGKKQGLEADVWALGCTVIEMATGRPPWRGVEDAGAFLYRVGFGKNVPELPNWISEEGKDFLGKCLRREAEERWSVDELLMHPFLLNLSSPKSILDTNYWDLSSEEDEGEQQEERAEFTSKRSNLIDELFSGSNRPNWTWDEDWITVRTIDDESRPNWTWDEDWITVRTIDDESSTGENFGFGNGTISTGANQNDMGDLRHDLNNIGGDYEGDGLISCINCNYARADSDQSIDQVGGTSEIIVVGNWTTSTSSSEEFVLSANEDDNHVVITDDCERDGEISSDNRNSLTIFLNSNWIFVSVPVVSILLLIIIAIIIIFL